MSLLERTVLLALAVAGCAQVAPGLPDAATQPPIPQAPTDAPYRVQVGDVLSIRLYLSPELDEDVTVRPDGRISTTLAPGIQAYGRTPDELAVALRPAYGRELRDPRVEVEVKTASPERIYVAGEVAAPGEFTTAAGPGLTLLQAVSRAGGLRVSGDPDHVLILRRGPGDTPHVLAAGYGLAMSGADPTADIRLAPFDLIYVPKTGINQAYIWFNQHIQQFVPVSWGFSYNVNPLVSGAR